MKLSVVSRAATRADGDVLIVDLVQGEKLAGEAAQLDRVLKGLISAALEEEKFEGKVGQTTHLHTTGRIPAKRVLVVGLGKEVTPDAIRKAAGAAARRARDLGARVVSSILLGGEAKGVTLPQRAQSMAEGVLLGLYQFDRYKREKNLRRIEQLRVLVRAQARRVQTALNAGQIFAEATNLARDLVNEPANRVTPAYLADLARLIARQGGLRIKVLDRKDIKRMGMGAFLGVAQGSRQPPKFIHLTYRPRGRVAKRVALVGKGVTFDSGGLNLKPADGMEQMKTDMSGAAAILGIMSALPRLRPDVEVIALIAATENMPSGTAYRPGDILRAMNGTTIEVGNTDAEGRLTLADALVYATRQRPAEIIDLATLTGACVVALGTLVAGVMGNNKPLQERMLKAASAAGEPLWPLPLYEEYMEGIKSEVADLKNVGPRSGGALTAGLFLQEFVGGAPWVHLDIAGPARSDKESGVITKGGTGFGVRTLLTYLIDTSKDVPT